MNRHHPSLLVFHLMLYCARKTPSHLSNIDNIPEPKKKKKEKIIEKKDLKKNKKEIKKKKIKKKLRTLWVRRKKKI